MGNESYSAGSEANTGRLGFGSARLLTHLDRKSAAALIHVALDCGISHHDVARSYGDGRTEAILGDVAKSRRGEMTIVTKAGLFPPHFVSRALRKAHRLTGRTHDAAARHSFAPGAVRSSLEKSLRALRTDHVDALLLHDCTLEDVSDELKAVLLQARQTGLTKRIGVAAEARQASAIAAAHPEIADIVQVAAGALHSLVPPLGVQVITHSVMASTPSGMRERTWDKKLRDALIANPKGVVLFSSSQAEHIRQNIAIAQDLFRSSLDHAEPSNDRVERRSARELG